jgi:DNA-binding SARP family transcriptional activator/WD40 repeat protein
MAERTAQDIGAGDGDGPRGLRFRLLGPLQVIDARGRVIDVGGSKPRLLLVHLLLNPNRMVATDALVDALWGDDAPPTARRSLQSHVAKLRAALGGDDGPLQSQPPGYVLAVDAEQVDLWRSEALTREARRSMASDPRRSLQLARLARQDWNGEPLADLAGHDPLMPQLRRLEQMWLDVIEVELDAEMAVGDSAAAVARLESLVIERPEHEPFWARLMTAYYRLGRQRDALVAYDRARAALLDTLGVDPSPELQRLEMAILNQAPEIDHGPPETCPYKGLASYQRDDSGRFCGRDELIAELVEAVRAASLVVLVGSSGAGKSSVLRAGLVSAIEAGQLGPAREAAVITPGAAPMRSIYQVTRSADLIIVDQFEELFTLSADEAVQREFVRVLLAMRTGDGRRVVISLRADFYGSCTKIPELAPLLARRQVVVGPLTERELRTAITRPAQQAGLDVADDLVDAIVAEAADHAGALPLISHALVETWERRVDDRLTLAAYREAGSIAGAIARTAENVFGGFTPEQRLQAQRLFLRLVEPGDSTEHTRRRVPFAHLEGSSIDPSVVDVLVEARLLTADAEGVEIAHEALIDAWPRLRSWIDDDREGIRLHRHLTSSASAWAELGRDDGELYRGARLSAALAWIADAAPDLSSLERKFVDASVDAGERELRAQQRTNRRLRMLVAASIVGVIVAGVATALAIRTARDADRGRAEAEAARLVATIGSRTDLPEVTVLQLAVAADRLASTPVTQGLLLNSISLLSGLVSQGEVVAHPAGDAPISSTGGVVLALDANVLGVVLDATTLEPVVRNRRALAAVVDTGERLLALEGSGAAGSALRVVDLYSGDSLGPAVTAQASRAALSPDGASLAVASPGDNEPGDQVAILDVASGRQQMVVDMQNPGAVRNLAFSPDGHYLVGTVEGSSACVWDTTTGRQIVATPAVARQSAITRVAMAPSGRLLAFGRADGQVEMWATDGSSEWEPLNLVSSHRDRVTWIDFDADGRRMVSTSDDGEAIVWDGATGDMISAPLAFDGAPGAITFFRPASATRLVTIDARNSTWEWDLERSGGLHRIVRGVNLGASVSNTRNTTMLVSRGSDLTVHDLVTGDETGVALDATEAVLGVAASGDGTRAVIVRDDGSVELLDSTSGDVVAAIDVRALVDDGEVMIAVDDDGSRIAYLTRNRHIEIVGGETAIEPIRLAPWRQDLQALDISDDGSELVLSTAAGEAVWYDLEGLGAASIAPLGEGFDAQFVDDGRIAVVGANGIQVIDPRSSRSQTQFNVAASTKRIAIDPTGGLVATLDESGKLQLWEADSHFAIGDAMRDFADAMRIAFSADGRFLVVAGREDTAWFDVRVSEWPRFACSVVGDAALSTEEMSRLLATDDLAEACP